MVTVAEARQAVEQRGRQVSAVQQRVEAFQPQRLELTQRQLRAGDIRSLKARKQLVEKRIEAKREAVGKVETEVEKQRRLEAEVSAAEAAVRQPKYSQGDIKIVKKALAGTISSKLLTPNQRDLLNRYEMGIEAGIQKLQEQEGYTFGTELRKEVEASLTARLSGELTEEEFTKQLEIDLTDPEMRYTPYTPELDMTLDPSQFYTPAPKERPTVVKMPTVSERIRGEIKKVTDISIPSGRQVRETFHPREWAKIPEYGGAVVSTIATSAKFPEVKIEGGKDYAIIPPSELRILTEKGVIEEKKFFEKGTGIIQQGRKEVTLLGPKTVGRAAQIGAYFYPPTAIPAIIGTIWQGVETYKRKVPTVDEVIKERTPELSAEERKAYLKTEEGKRFKTDVLRYVQSLRKQKKAGLIQAGVGVTALMAPPLYRGTKYLATPTRTPLTEPVPKQLVSQVGIIDYGKTKVGIKVGGTYTPPWMAIEQRRISKLFGLKGKEVLYQPARKDVTGAVFLIEGEKATARLMERKLRKDVSLKKYFQTAEVIKPVEILDLSKLPKIPRYVAGKMPTRVVGKDVTSYIGISKTYKGRPSELPGVRLMRESRYMKQYFIPTRPPTADIGIHFTRVKPLPSVGKVQRFVTETGTKFTKSLSPRAIGKVSIEQAEVFIIKIPKPTKTIGFKAGKPKSLTKVIKKDTELVVKAVQIAPKLPKPKIPKPKPIVKTEQYPLYPKTVGGLGRGISQYYGKGVAVDVVEVPAQVQLGVVKPQLDVLGPTQFPKDKVEFVQLVAKKPFEVSRTKQLVLEKEREKVIPRVIQPIKAREKLKDAVIVREKIVAVPLQPTVQRTKPKPRFPVIPTPRPRPRPKPRPKKSRPRPPKTSDVPPEKIFKRPAKKKELVVPFVRRYGKFIPVGKPAPKKVATRKGIAQLRKTLAAALQLRKPSGEVIPISRVSKEFRPGKELTIVQRAPKRLTAREEVAEIIRARKAGRIKFI